MVALTALPATSRADDLVGTVGTVYDGDTFGLCDAEKCTRIRICGIDCPEAKRSGYQQSKEALERLLAGQTIRCRPVGDGTVCDGRSKRWNRGRLVAQCFLPDGTDIAAAMIRNGICCDWVKFS